ncbi:hypothetical protein HMPREF0666_01149 [Prevotella sp. C561]|uniref:hypothetical protein n=1 Tax=Prevotella sp. C561 TaxID=563031 RepID=UPI000223741A|nr:hypothetical protein [Prevotella sp. C561]EGW47692.1 hypothetical protein HMPREF0666_01149 [Prevotella sp. C561]
MKYYGSILDFTQERTQELMRVYQEELSKAGYIVMPKIFEQVANSPCSRFWVSEERAAIVISTLLAGKVIPNMRKNKREMFDEIFRRFLIAREQYPEKSIYALAIMVVNQPAPKFYMTPRTVGELIYRIKNGWYEKQFNRYKNYSQVDKEEL